MSQLTVCQQYVSQLASVRQDALKDAGAKIVVIGCGEWKLIENYKGARLLPCHSLTLLNLIRGFADISRNNELSR